MLDKLKDILRQLEDTEEYKRWREEHQNSFLSSCFIVDDQGWQLAFYSPKNKKLSTFLKDRLVQSDTAIFKIKGEDVEQLNLDDVKIELDEAFAIADSELVNNHPGYKPVKKIIVLQKILQPMWNLTYLTSSFYIFNIKINATNKNIISQDFISSLYNNQKKNPALS